MWRWVFLLVPHAPAWECFLGRVASFSLSRLYAKSAGVSVSTQAIYAKEYGLVYDATRQGRYISCRLVLRDEAQHLRFGGFLLGFLRQHQPTAGFSLLVVGDFYFSRDRAVNKGGFVFF